MLGLFKRSKVENWEVELIKNIFGKLPLELDRYKKQTQDGLFNRVFFGSKIRSNYVGFSYNPLISKKYEDKMGRVFTLKGIKVFDLKSNTFIEINIHIAFGLITGYSTPNVAKFNLDANRLDISNFYAEYQDNTEFKDLADLFTKEEIALINPDEVYEITVKNKTYYHLKDLEDGDFLGIDKEKNIYKISHDPFEIIKLKESLIQILK